MSKYFILASCAFTTALSFKSERSVLFQSPVKESTKLDPWTVMARFKLQVEDDLSTISNLNYIILRPAVVYGIGDKSGISEFVSPAL